MSPKLKSLLTFLIGWPLSLLALFFIFKTFLPSWQDIVKNLQHINFWSLMAGVVCFFLYYAFRSYVWHKLLSSMGHSLQHAETVYLWSVSEVKRYIPGNIWSFVGRGVAFTEKGVTKRDIAKALLFEQEIILLAALMVSVLSLPFLASYVFPFLRGISNLNVLGILFIVLVGGIYIFLPRYISRLPQKAQRVSRYLFPNFSVYDTFTLLFFSCLAFLFFGFGYFFSIAALHFLDPQLFFTLSGFFVFSLVVGLLSFLTPTGLGVREGMITIGLSKLMPLSVAGFASLFGRIILVFSEVIFLAVAFSIYKVQSKLIARIVNFITKYKYESILFIFISLFTIYFSAISFLRYENFYTGRFDLGNMDQTVWNTAHGRIFELTDPNGTEVVSRLAFHSDFILAGLAPFYWIWEDARMLLLIQVVVLGCGAIFIYLLARDVLRNKLLALAFAFSYLLHPAMQRTVIYDFHAVTLATTFLLGAFYFLYKKKYWWFVIFSLLAGITKEEIWTITALLGLYLLLKSLISNQFSVVSFQKLVNRLSGFQSGKQKTDKLPSENRKPKTDNRKPVLIGLSVFLVSILMFYYLMWYAIPQAGRGPHFALSYFSQDSDSPSELIKNIIFSPQETFEKVIDPERVKYYKRLLGPIGYLSLASPLYLIFPVADITLNVLGDKPQLHQIYYQYTAPITPFLYIAAIFGVLSLKKIKEYILRASDTSREVSRISSRFSRQVGITRTISFNYVFVGYIVIVSIYTAYLYGPLPGAVESNLAMINRPRPDKEYIQASLDQIGSSYSVAASNALGANLSHREYIYTLPHGVDTADVVVFLLSGGYNMPSQDWHVYKVAELREDPKYEVWFERGEFVVFKKRNDNPRIKY